MITTECGVTVVGAHGANAVRVDPHGHTAVFGHGPSALASAAAQVFHTARGSGEAFVLVTDDADVASLTALPGREELLASGRLRVLCTAAAYPHRDPARLFAAWSAELTGLLAAGWTGMRVVADNTPLARGSDGAFAAWLGWEHTTTLWQAANPVVASAGSTST